MQRYLPLMQAALCVRMNQRNQEALQAKLSPVLESRCNRCDQQQAGGNPLALLLSSRDGDHETIWEEISSKAQSSSPVNRLHLLHRGVGSRHNQVPVAMPRLALHSETTASQPHASPALARAQAKQSPPLEVRRPRMMQRAPMTKPQSRQLPF